MYCAYKILINILKSQSFVDHQSRDRNLSCLFIYISVLKMNAMRVSKFTIFIFG